MDTPRERVLKVLLRILSRPYVYTRRDLAKYFEISRDAIDEDIAAIKAAGLRFDQDKPHYRCAIIPDRTFKELQYLQPLSKEDQYHISKAISQFCKGKEALYLKNKLNSLYDFQQLGIRALRRPALERIDRLEAGKRQKKQVILEKYRSNSNKIKDRTVEPFHIDAELDTLQAFDLEHQSSRHFRLSRIERVNLLEEDWQYESKHDYKYTDVFRIADNQQETVRLQLDVYAYNNLIETYPKALSEVYPAAEANTFDFQTKVNYQFLGLSNFILANAQHVTIISPDTLKDKIRNISIELQKKLEK